MKQTLKIFFVFSFINKACSRKFYEKPKLSLENGLYTKEVDFRQQLGHIQSSLKWIHLKVFFIARIYNLITTMGKIALPILGENNFSQRCTNSFQKS